MNRIYKSIAIATITLTAAVALTACNDNRNCSYDGNAHSLTCPEKTYRTVATTSCPAFTSTFSLSMTLRKFPIMNRFRSMFI